MTVQEFKAWFQGFTEGFEGKIPSKAQWNRIQAQVEKIDNISTCPPWYYPVYIREKYLYHSQPEKVTFHTGSNSCTSLWAEQGSRDFLSLGNT